MRALDFWCDDGKHSGSVLVTDEASNGFPEACAIKQELGANCSFVLRALTIAEERGDSGITLNDWLRNRRVENDIRYRGCAPSFAFRVYR